MAGKAAYIADSPLLLGLRWLRMELSLSVAMIEERQSVRVTGEGMNVEEKEEEKEKVVGCGGKSVTESQRQ